MTHKQNTDSEQYQLKKKFFDKVLTVYGRKPALEAMLAPGVRIFKLHLSKSNKAAPILEQIQQAASEQNAEIVYHDKQALSRISKNQKQDQGVAVDIIPQGFTDFEAFVDKHIANANVQKNHNSSGNPPSPLELIAVDNITNPQNLGMIVRSVCASPAKGLLLPKRGCAKLDSLVIKASAGTLFKANIIRCDNLKESLQQLKQYDVNIVGLEAQASKTIKQYASTSPSVFVLGNETDGISPQIQDLCTHKVKIPMSKDVESLNVAVTASLIAFRNVL